MFKSVLGVGSISGFFLHGYYAYERPPQNTDGSYTYLYQIEDSDFTELWAAQCKQELNYTEVRAPAAIISCYEQKRLDVAYNLYLYHKYMMDRYSWYNLEREIEFNIQHSVLYNEYAPLVKKYFERVNNLKAFW